MQLTSTCRYFLESPVDPNILRLHREEYLDIDQANFILLSGAWGNFNSRDMSGEKQEGR